MFEFFFTPTTNEWDEAVYALTLPGMIAVVFIILLLLVLSLLFGISKKKASESKQEAGTKKKAPAKTIAVQLAFSGVAMALSLITSEFLPSVKMPWGGSITLFSMFFISLIGYLFGLKTGLMCAIAYGFLQFILDPRFYSIPQMLTDYPLAFGALGLSGLFARKKNGIIPGFITGVLGRYFFSFLSGILFFASYAPEGTPVAVYSITYNGIYLVPEAIVTILLLLIPAVRKGVSELKKMTLPGDRL